MALEYSCKKITKKIFEKVEKLFESEIEEYDMYLRGEVYGYKAFKVTSTEESDGNDVDEEELDSCWGYYGLDYLKKELNSMYGKGE